MDEPPILRVIEREGLVRLIPITDGALKTLLRHLIKTFNLEDVEALYMDDYPAYNTLGSHHGAVNHSQGEYARARFT